MSQRMVATKRPNPYTGPRFVPTKRPRTVEQMQVEQVKRIVRNQLEFKYSDVDVTPTAIGWDGVAFNLLTNMARGDGGTQFDGDQVKPASLQIRLKLTQVAANTGTTCFRVIVGQSKVLGLAAAANILQDLGDVTSPLSDRLYSRKKQYKVLLDRMYILDPSQAKSNIDHFYIKGKRFIPIDYETGSLTITRGHIFMVVVNDQDQATSLDNIAFYSRLTYTD